MSSVAFTVTVMRSPLFAVTPLAGAVIVTTGGWSAVIVRCSAASAWPRLPEVSVAAADTLI